MKKSIDPERAERLIGSMREAVGNLLELSRLEEKEFYSDKHKQGSAKYNFIVAIEAAIDLASHLISKNAFRPPEDYADSFRVLAEAGIIESSFAGELEKMARFRNRLVHLYWNVNIEEVWRILQRRLGDFEKFIKQLGKYINKP
jgi:uncharacterized protein YutE (UPF0331/DUF86 family)